MNKKQWIIVIVVAVLVVLVALMITSASMFRDITITHVTAPSAGVHGQKIDVSSTLKNRGIVSTGNFDVNFYLTPERNMNNKIFLGKLSINDLTGREIEQQNTSVIIPTNTTPGNYYLLAYADMNNGVKELDDKNNGRFSTNTIVIS
jgi:trimeric autotransporter adhesin